MKVVRVERLLDVGLEPSVVADVLQDVETAIKTIEWPPGSGSFILRDEPGKKRGQGNGVKPIKDRCLKELESLGWRREARVEVAGLEGRSGRRGTGPGPPDAAKNTPAGLFCVEWETGNISSSHRAINKMALGILKRLMAGGILILPTRQMYRYLTDRVGNFPELEPYFTLVAIA